jgi:hypothetical protein
MDERMNMRELYELVWPGPKPFLLWLLGPGLTWAGCETMCRGVSTIAGMFTSLIGLIIAIMGFVWWLRRLAEQNRKRKQD